MSIASLSHLWSHLLLRKFKLLFLRFVVYTRWIIPFELWEWRGEDYYLQKDCNLDICHSLWDSNQNEHLPYMFDDTTPVKACGDLAYSVSNSRKNSNKEVEEYKEYSSQVKRRRMLQFSPLSTDSLLCDENTQFAFEKSKDKEDYMEEVSPENTQWDSGCYGDRSAFSNGGLDQSSEEWLSNCFSDGGMQLSSDDMNVSGFSDDQIDISEFCNISEMESDSVKICPTPTPTPSPSPKIVYKGRKSHILTPTNLASSVAYPFALIKPCGVHGDMTLKEINQRILSPAQSISKNDRDDNPSVSYPTSAFSGKPVVVKTKIRTEGGKGSITIMRTRG
ncbi:hypothetical protein IFM89_007348 [Coptis chinensis]|uniref:Protein XRI1 n=1 Tax=Coptis chinensis TaxID=261450 RepID=A0A835H742_9MAGN|nr:hypothetical protein IFM89_007348 [Coptis chinensis]